MRRTPLASFLPRDHWKLMGLGYVFALAVSFGVSEGIVLARAKMIERPASTVRQAGAIPMPAFNRKADNEIVLFSNGVEVDRWEMR